MNAAVWQQLYRSYSRCLTKFVTVVTAASLNFTCSSHSIAFKLCSIRHTLISCTYLILLVCHWHFFKVSLLVHTPQCFDAVGWVASGL